MGVFFGVRQLGTVLLALLKLVRVADMGVVLLAQVLDMVPRERVGRRGGIHQACAASSFLFLFALNCLKSKGSVPP